MVFVERWVSKELSNSQRFFMVFSPAIEPCGARPAESRFPKFDNPDFPLRKPFKNAPFRQFLGLYVPGQLCGSMTGPSRPLTFLDGFFFSSRAQMLWFCYGFGKRFFMVFV